MYNVQDYSVLYNMLGLAFYSDVESTCGQHQLGLSP